MFGNCDYCDEAIVLLEELQECNECDWCGHVDCHSEHYLTTHDNTVEINEPTDEPEEEFDEGCLGGTDQDF